MGDDARKKFYSRQQKALWCTTSLGASSTLPLLCMLAPQEENTFHQCGSDDGGLCMCSTEAVD